MIFGRPDCLQCLLFLPERGKEGRVEKRGEGRGNFQKIVPSLPDKWLKLENFFCFQDLQVFQFFAIVLTLKNLKCQEEEQFFLKCVQTCDFWVLGNSKSEFFLCFSRIFGAKLLKCVKIWVFLRISMFQYVSRRFWHVLHKSIRKLIIFLEILTFR